MRRRSALAAALITWCLTAATAPGAEPAVDPPTPATLTVTPAEVTLTGPDSAQRLLVIGAAGDGAGGRQYDYGRAATYETSDPSVATVSVDGEVVPHGDGKAVVTVRVGGLAAEARVEVVRFGARTPVSFGNQVVPVFTKTGCNSGGCHGKSSGQNGFKLSLLGFDPAFDHDAVTREGRGRRVFPAAPERSLLLRKAVAEVPHGGGRRVEPGSVEYATLLRWVEEGTPPPSAGDPSVVRVECQPKRASVVPHGSQQVIVTAFYSDGSHRDVTREAQFKSNETDVAKVDDHGLVKADAGTGETADMARYMGRVDVCRVTIPRPSADGPAESFSLAKQNYVDEFIQDKWKALNLTPSPVADDATFLRRAFLDAIGTLPTPEEVREFLADPSPNKRSAWVDKLLARGEYADFWAIKWGDLLRNKRAGDRDHMRGTYAFHAWIRNAFATNMPYDQFVRNIIAAQGTVDQHPPVIWYRSVRNLTHQTNDTAQLFLGTRINCAQCHNHPYEKWTQNDYYSFQAFFARVGRKSGETSQEPAIFVQPNGQVRHPVSGKLMEPRGLDGPEVKVGEDDDPRQGLVDWMADPKNPFFAPALANRLWAHFMGRGLVEPVDDLRVTNPPSNPALLDALANDFVAHKFDVKHLIRTIMESSAYQLSSDPQEGNAHDRQNYARAYPRRMPAEVMLDAIGQVTGTTQETGVLPRGTRMIQLPDESINSYFLDVFGRPMRETACECERPREANLAQALQLLNSNDMQQKVSATLKGRPRRPARGQEAARPRGRRRALPRGARPGAVTRGGAAASVLGIRRPAARPQARPSKTSSWALVNTKEFLFNH